MQRSVARDGYCARCFGVSTELLVVGREKAGGVCHGRTMPTEVMTAATHFDSGDVPLPLLARGTCRRRDLRVEAGAKLEQAPDGCESEAAVQCLDHVRTDNRTASPHPHSKAAGRQRRRRRPDNERSVGTALTSAVLPLV